MLMVKCWTGKLIQPNTSQVNGEVRIIFTSGGETNQVRGHLLPSLVAKHTAGGASFLRGSPFVYERAPHIL